MVPDMTSRATFHVRTNEWILLAAIAAAGLCSLPAVLGGAPIDWSGYIPTMGAAAAVLVAGVAYRRSGRSEPIAAALTATSLLLVFTAVLATYNYLLLPSPRASIDPLLAAIDARLGYRWSDLVAFAAARPGLSWLLAQVYMSSLAQLACLVVALGLTGRFAALERMTTALVVGAVVTVTFWGLFPSIGVAAYQSPGPPEAEAAAGLITGTRIGAELLGLLEHGPSRIAPDEIMGLIAFPSFHTVLAVLCAWFAFGVRLLRGPFLLLNALMVPALLLHGGHYLIDVPAGIAVALGAVALSDRLHGFAEAAGGRGAQPTPAATLAA